MVNRRAVRSTAVAGVVGLLGSLAGTSAQADPRYRPPTATRGATVVDVLESDRDNDGNIDLRTTTTLEFDSKGQLVKDRQVQEVDANDDGDVDDDNDVVNVFTSEYTYGDAGLLSFVLEIDLGNDSVIDRRDTTTAVYDSKGNLVRAVETRDPGADGDDVETRTTDFQQSTKPPVTTKTITLDIEGDGDAEEIVTVRTTFDRKGRVVEVLTETDWDADDHVDQAVREETTYNKHGGVLTEERTVTEGDKSSATLLENRYEKGLLVGFTQTYEDDSEEVGVYTYDKNGRVLTAVTTSYSSDGEERRVSTDTFEYDKSGLLITFMRKEESAGGRDILSTQSYEYDGKRRLIKTTTEDDLGLYVYEVTYDAKGNVVEAVDSRYDSDNPGELLYQNVFAAEYDKKGAVVANTVSTDSDGDGVFDDVTTYTRTIN